MLTGINRYKYTFCIIKSAKQLNNLKTSRVPLLDLFLQIWIKFFKIYLMRQYV